MDIHRASDLLVSVSVRAEENRAKISSLAFAASEELQQMALEKEPLWLFDEVKKVEVLNIVEYRGRFAPVDATLEDVIRVITTGGPINQLPEQHNNVEFLRETGKISRSTIENDINLLETEEIEASRAIGVVYTDPATLVNMLMNVDHWSSVFSNIVSEALNLGLLSTGELGSPNGLLQVVTAEFHVPSPLVRTREIYFARCCRQLASSTWLVTDVSLESVFPNPALRCQRRPSGCLIQALHDGKSKVTWVENNAVSNGFVPHMFRPIFQSGFTFSAKRWIATLERHYDRNTYLEVQFDRFAVSKDENRLGPGTNALLKLAERMVRNYNANVSSSAENLWKPLPIRGAEDILVKTSFNLDDPGLPHGVAVTIATSVWLNIPQIDVFNFLCNGHNRNKWDVLCYGRVTRDMVRISSGRDPANWVTIVLAEAAAKEMEMLYVQEAFSDSLGLYVVFAPIDTAAMHHILDGNNPDIVSILPCGFAVMPFRAPMHTGESILTISFQIVDEELSTPEYLPPNSVLTTYRIINATVDLIKAALSFPVKQN